jgi:hypothetical protein
MPFILAIEPDRRQAAKIFALAKHPLRAEVAVAESAEGALAVLANRIPDLILTSLLLSSKDEAALSDRLRELDAAGTHVQTLVTPVLGTAAKRGRRSSASLLTRLRGSKNDDAAPDGCDPAVFAQQIMEYLERIAADRLAASGAYDDAAIDSDPVFATRQQAELAEKPATAKRKKSNRPSALHEEPVPIAETVDPAPSVVAPPVVAPVVVAPVVVAPAPAVAASSAWLADEPGRESTAAAAAMAQGATREPDGAAVASRIPPPEPIVAEAGPAPARHARQPAAAEPVAQIPAPPKPEPPTRAPKRPVKVRTTAERDLAALAAALKSLEPTPPPAPPASSPVPDFSNVLTAIQRDLKQLQPEREELAPTSPRLIRRRKRILESLPVLGPVEPPVETAVEPPAAPTPIASRVKPLAKKAAAPQKPAVDEWGLFDPEQCGIAALIAKLDEINEEDEKKKTKKRA